MHLSSCTNFMSRIVMATFSKQNIAEKVNQRCFREDSHATRIMSNLLDLKKNGEFCDVILTAGNKDFYVHKIILVAASSYFSAMFKASLSEKYQEKVHIMGVETESLELLLDFSYTGQITITERNVEDLLSAADLLDFTYVKQSCANFLQDQLDPTNCLGMFYLGESYNCNGLCEAAQSFLNENFKTVAESGDILQLDAKQLKVLLESDNLHVDNEGDILELVIKWTSQDPEKNRWLSYLLPVVKLPFIPPKQLNEISRLVQGDIFAQDIVEGARTCHCECAGIPMRKYCASWLYIFGGEKSFMKETRSVEYFDCNSMEWKDTLRMTSGHVACAITVLNNKLYVIGGCRQGNKLNTVKCYNPESNTWENAACLSKCQGDVKAAVLNGNIYIAGGSCSGQPTCSYVEKYCPIDNKWSTVCNMTHKRRRFVLVTSHKSLYAIGGFDDSQGFLSSIEHYVLELNKWQEDSPMFSKRGDFGAVELSGYIYAVGGVNEQQGSLCSVERYNPSTDSWTMMASMKFCRGGLATAVYCGKIFALNGMNEYMSVVDSVECYDETLDSWNSVASTNIARFGAAAIAYSYLISR